MPSITTVIRCRINRRNVVKSFKDIFTNADPAFWNSTNLEFQFAFFDGEDSDAELMDISLSESITLEVKSITNKLGAAFMTQTVAAADLNPDLTLEEWQTGAVSEDQKNCHVSFFFPSNETQLPLAGLDKKTFWLSVTGVSTGLNTFGCSTLTAIEDGRDPDSIAPVQAGNIVPEGATYDGAGAYELAVTEARTYGWTKGANDTSITNGTETVLTTGDIFIAQGESITLNGTAGQLVTAVIRIGFFLTTDQSDARYFRKSFTNVEEFQLKSFSSVDNSGAIKLAADTATFTRLRAKFNEFVIYTPDLGNWLWALYDSQLLINKFSLANGPNLTFSDLDGNSLNGFQVTNGVAQLYINEAWVNLVDYLLPRIPDDANYRFKDGQHQFLDDDAATADATKPWRALGVKGGATVWSDPILD
jgi:hypothetical protein